MCSECEQTLGEASATNNVCAGGYGFVSKARVFACMYFSSSIVLTIYSSPLCEFLHPTL
jgi:hypothetical protein